MREVLAALVDALEAGRDVALCRVVAVRGSTPQGAGAALLLEPDGTQVGTLGGGCVEAEVRREAAGLMGRGGVVLRRFTLDHDPAWADGLICGGRMTILAECPRDPAALAYYRAYLDRLRAGRGVTEAVVIDADRAGAAVGARFLFDRSGLVVASLGAPADWPADLVAGLPPPDDRPRAAEVAGWATLPTPPTARLLVVGAGHVGRAVAEMAARVDFAVTVVDDRPDQASPARFPNARRLVGPIGDVLRGLDVTAATYALIVTRGHGHDQEALGILAPSPAAYVGMIGSRRKVREIRDALLDVGVPEAALARVAMPVGLPIGSGTVDEIAVSIVAELIARRNLGPAATDRLRAAGGRSTA